MESKIHGYIYLITKIFKTLEDAIKFKTNIDKENNANT